MSFCGTGGWTGPLPGDPDNNSILSATPAFGGIDVSYSYPTTNAHAVAHALLYRGLTPVFGEALRSLVMTGNTYYDKVDSANQYYYWIRIVSTNGTVGDPIGPATAVARPLIQDLIVQLTGQIDSGVLAQSLKADLDKITLNYGEMIDEIANRVQGDAALSAALANVQEGLVNALAFIDSEVTARMTSQGALIEQVDTVAALNQDTAALLSQVQTAMVDGQAALSERIDQIAVTSEAAGAAAIEEQRLASIARDEALALAITSAEARIGDDVAQVETALTANVNLVGDKVNAMGALYTAKVKVNGLIGGFAVYNDGTEVEAGFDVDSFWIGRTNENKRKPFMVVGDETFIDQAAINSLVITKLRDESGRVVVDSGGLAIRNAEGEIIFSAGKPLQWEYVAGDNKPQDGATRNVFMGQWVTGTAYAAGDIVLDATGYGWSSKVAHVSSDTVKPPVYPVQSNTYWALYAVKGADGANGSNAKLAYLSATSQVFLVSKEGNTSPPSITLNATGQNLTGSPVFTVTAGTATLTGTGNSRALAYAGMTTDTVTIKVVWDGLEDFITINKVREGWDGSAGVDGADGSNGADGLNGLTVVLTNEAHTLPASTAGAVSSYVGSGTQVQVFEGSVALTASASATVGAFRVGAVTQVPAATITPGAVGYAGTVATLANHAGMVVGTDSVVLTVPVTIYRSNGTSVTVNKLQTLTKSKTGSTGATGAVGAAGTDGADGVDGQDGASAITALLSNEAHVFPASSTGVVTSYASSGTELRVWEGAVLLAYDGVGTANGTFRVNRNSVTNTVVGTITDSGNHVTFGVASSFTTAADTAEIVYTITGKTLAGVDFVMNKTQTFTKAKAGAVGATGATGSQGVQGPVGATGATLYTWLKYADSPTTGMSDSPTGKAYIGLAYNKSTATESSTYADYAWSLVQGAQGTQGIPGVAGANGVTTYTWVKYGTSAAGAGLSDSPTGNAYIGLAYNKTTATESTNPADYTWSLIKGADGVDGETGPAGPAVVLVSDRPATFTSTDGTLDSGQANLVFTANAQGITSPAYVWSFSGLQTNPTASTTASQTITAAQFGTSKAAIVVVTVNGSIVDKMTIVRLERSTAEAGATVGGTIGVNIDGQINAGNASTFIANAAINAAQIGQLDAGSITTGTLLAGTIDVSKIAGQMHTLGPGNHSRTVPANFTRMRVVTVGGGGGGGLGGGGWSSSTGAGGGGGGSGGLHVATFVVTPGQTISATVGNGGWYNAGGEPTIVHGYISATGGAGGGNASNAYGITPGVGGAGGPGGTRYGNSGQTGTEHYSTQYCDYLGKNCITASTPGSGGAGGASVFGAYGAGGRGGNGHNSAGISAGAAGYCQIEFFNPNGVIIRSDWDTLQSALTRQGIQVT